MRSMSGLMDLMGKLMDLMSELMDFSEKDSWIYESLNLTHESLNLSHEIEILDLMESPDQDHGTHRFSTSQVRDHMRSWQNP